MPKSTFPLAKVAIFPETFDVISMSFASKNDFLVLLPSFLRLFRTFVAQNINMDNMQQDYRALCEAVEQKSGKRMQTPLDFEWLGEKIENKTKERVSASTLMRLWGYRQGVATRQSTLDILARYLGYADYVMFCRWLPANTDEPQSDEVVSRHLQTSDLQEGQQVELTWSPDRRCVIELRSDGQYEVLEAENTKLSVGDTFRCDIFIEGEPLYLSQLVHEGRLPMVFVAGKKSGIHFEVTGKE